MMAPLVLHKFDRTPLAIRLHRWSPYFNTSSQTLHKTVTSAFYQCRRHTEPDSGPLHNARATGQQPH